MKRWNCSATYANDAISFIVSNDNMADAYMEALKRAKGVFNRRWGTTERNTTSIHLGTTVVIDEMAEFYST